MRGGYRMDIPSRASNSQVLQTSNPCSQNRQSLISTKGWVQGQVWGGNGVGDLLDLSVAMVLVVSAKYKYD